MPCLAAGTCSVGNLGSWEGWEGKLLVVDVDSRRSGIYFNIASAARDIRSTSLPKKLTDNQNRNGTSRS